MYDTIMCVVQLGEFNEWMGLDMKLFAWKVFKNLLMFALFKDWEDFK